MPENKKKAILSDYLFNKASARKILLSCAFEISPLCNMDCKMCYIRMTKEELDKRGRLRTIDEWIQIAEQLKEMGTLYILITGGEPFLYKDFKELYIKLYNMGFVISINSNATLINDEIVEWLSQYPPQHINVTLYGGSNKTYKRLCNNPKGFDQATRGIKLMQDAGIRVKINCSVTPYNECDLESIFAFGKKHKLQINATSYMYPPIRKDETSIGKNNRFTPEEAATNFVRINKIRMEKEQFMYHAKRVLEDMVLEDDSLGDECLVQEGQSMKCRAGKSTGWFSWDGKMMPCGMMNSPVAYPFEEGVKNAWSKIIEETDKLRLPVECSNCKKRGICKACAATSVAEAGSISKEPKYMCNMTDKIIEKVSLEYDEMEKEEVLSN